MANVTLKYGYIEVSIIDPGKTAEELAELGYRTIYGLIGVSNQLAAQQQPQTSEPQKEPIPTHPDENNQVAKAYL